MNDDAITKLTSAIEKLTSAVESHTLQLMEAAVAPGKSNGQFQSKYTHEEEQRLIEMHDNKMTCAQMSARLPGHSPTSIYHKLRRLKRIPHGPTPH